MKTTEAAITRKTTAVMDAKWVLKYVITWPGLALASGVLWMSTAAAV